MADQIARRNERAREQARGRGQITFMVDVVEAWPGCVECGGRIRPSLWSGTRLCNCPGVRWSFLPDGWERVPEPAAARPARDTNGGEPT